MAPLGIQHTIQPRPEATRPYAPMLEQCTVVRRTKIVRRCVRRFSFGHVMLYFAPIGQFMLYPSIST